LGKGQVFQQDVFSSSQFLMDAAGVIFFSSSFRDMRPLLDLSTRNIRPG